MLDRCCPRLRQTPLLRRVGSLFFAPAGRVAGLPENRTGRYATILLAFLLVGLGPIGSGAAESEPVRAVYHSPLRLAFSPDGKQLAVSDYTAGAVAVIQSQTGHVVNRFATGGNPSGIVWSRDGNSVFVGDCADRSAVQIAVAKGRTTRHAAGARPMDVALLPEGGRLLTANSAGDSVSALDLAGEGAPREIAAGREPYSIAVTGNERLAVVANRLPAGDASSPEVSATVTLIDMDKLKACATIRLPPNSTNVHGVCVSPDGRWAYVAHNLARAQLPTEQIEYGWINANAMTVVDLVRQRRYATVLLDRFNDGAANPFGVAVSPRGAALWLTLSGVHQLGRIDMVRLHSMLGQRETEGRAPADQEQGSACTTLTAIPSWPVWT